MLKDGWTAITVDGSYSAHFEHTVAITKDGPIITHPVARLESIDGEVKMQITDAVEADIRAVTEIYNDVIRTSTAVFHDAPVSVEDRTAWWKARLAQGYPLLVAKDGDAIVGFATFGDFRPWPGYRFTVEGTIHIHANARRQGVGAALLDAHRSREG